MINKSYKLVNMKAYEIKEHTNSDIQNDMDEFLGFKILTEETQWRFIIKSKMTAQSIKISIDIFAMNVVIHDNMN